jgi:RNA polymerase sigma factor (sigma-70 family)
MTPQEQDLIAQCVRGEKAAWEAFVQQYSNLVYHSIRQTLNTHHVHPKSVSVEDLYQDFFIAMLADDCKKLRQFRGDQGCTLASWLRLVVVRLTIDRLRKLNAPVDRFPDEENEDLDPVGSVIRREQQAILAATIEKLAPRDRLLIELSFHQGLQPHDIAGILQMSVGAVYTQKSRVLDKLREFLEKSGSL